MKKALSEEQFLEVLRRVLPKTTKDPHVIGRIMDAVETELGLAKRAEAFNKFCQLAELPDLAEKSVQEVKRHFSDAFADAKVTVKANPKTESVAVEVALPEGRLTSEIKVRPPDADTEAGESGDLESELKFVPFPVCLPGDPELVWVLARRENLTGDEAAITLDKLAEDFWNSKPGLKLLREGGERSFPEFIARAPSKLFAEGGLKRHYKEPEPIQSLRVLAKPGKKRV